MKKYITIALIALGAVSVASCEKFLNVQTQGYPTQDQFFQNDQQAIDAIDACYARLPQEAVLGREIYWEQACANVIVWGRTRGFPTLATLSYNGDESPLRGVYDQAVNEDSAYEKLAAKKEEQAAAQTQPVQAPQYLLVNGVLRQVVPPEQAREYVQYNGYLWPII